MWPGDEEEEKKILVAKTLDEFRARLKSSFGSRAEADPPTEARACMVCCEMMSATRPPALLGRKCLKSAFPCERAARCSCVDRTAVCCACYTEMLWKSPRSQPDRGRFRAACPRCGAEFCHWDVIEAPCAPPVVEPVRPVKTRHELQRVCSDKERAALEQWRASRVLEAAARAQGDSIEARIVRFAHSSEGAISLPSLSSVERAVAHKIAESLSLDHVSEGQGAKRQLWIRKRKSAANSEDGGAIPPGADQVHWKGYLALHGESVEFAAHSHGLADVPQDWRAHREDRDGLEHHITLVSRTELEHLALAQTGAKKVTKEFVSDLLWTFACDVRNDWVARGRGQVQDGDSIATFVVVNWPQANLWRAEQGLAKSDFHITLGFSRSGGDIHGVPKGESTLIGK